MARETIIATLGTAVNSDGVYAAKAGAGADIAVSVDPTAMTAAMAVLVADGASPTQAHVTTANNAYTTLLASITAQQATVTGDLLVSVNLAVLDTSNKIMAAVRATLQALRNRYMISV